MEFAQSPLTVVPAWLTRAAIGMLVLASLSAAAMAGVTISLLQSMEATLVLEDSAAVELSTAADLEVPVRLTTWTIWAVTTCVWSAWLWRLLHAAARRARPRVSPEMAVGLLFVPVVNWVIPKRALDDAWRATGPASAPSSKDPLLRSWWALTALFMVAAASALALVPADAEYFDEQLPSYRADVLSYSLGAAAALLGAVVTWRFARRLAAADTQVAAGLRPPAPALAPAAAAASRRPAAIRACRGAGGVCLAGAAANVAASVAVLAGQPDPRTLDLVGSVVALLACAAMVPLAVWWLSWFHATVSAVRTAGATDGLPRPGVAVASWFVPGVQFVAPWRVLRRLLGPDVASRRRLGFAQGVFVVSSVAALPIAIFSWSTLDSLSTWRWYGPVSAVDYLVWAAMALALARVTAAVPPAAAHLETLAADS